ncbi:1-deoxy-D-xylulose-5-phosphate reductoisomerase [Clostridium cylindrosporum]|uniref:1-deoxy-D-xylulose 5-phosphate reductoisomerase n=1 Tax=Clostridium cylindrosporum DSM 605 TaxID=1121307 RepID=A0A0J8G623_CLOCY|nr:1-deoxy-D-xylulose-5-phosphate reductoisomerase [Clostridium cylindrosporum]KMT23076.1 1-deoxy-D-xylulose 5-phosphate reductoisomerase Dxr [Clostridium cylindrosporum DSM 605]
MKNLVILGSTGSIGTQALEVIRQKKSSYNVLALSANSNIEVIIDQYKEFKPKYIVISNYESYKILKDKLKNENVNILYGVEGLIEVSTLKEADMVLTSVMGMIGLKPTIEAIKKGKHIALANKETMVVGGEIIKNLLKKSPSKIIPVDSEHSAIFQCLQGNRHCDVNKVILTASGGPFRGKTLRELESVTLSDALKHPNWSMGQKITIDSATLINKALEVIEAHYLFDMSYDDIQVVVHPQSIIHSMVEYKDASVIAQMGVPSMKHPIQYAFEYPERSTTSSSYLDFYSLSSLTFEKPDTSVFKGLSLGYIAGREGGTMTTVFNAANEEAVKLFLEGKISFLQIQRLVEKAMEKHKAQHDYTVDDILLIERETRDFVNLSK